MAILPSQKKVAVLTRWLWYRGGPKTGFHCTCLHRCKSCHGRFEYNVGWYISVIIHVSVSNPSPLNTAFFCQGMPLYWPSLLSSSFPHILWNGIVASMRILLSLTPLLSLFIQSLIKFRVSFSVGLRRGIIFLAHLVCFSSQCWCWGEYTVWPAKECLCVRQGAGTTSL